MIVLTKEEFLDKKKSDTLVILGSGSSINKVTDNEWKLISSYDSIGFNWFCHHSFSPTFFLIREQANTKHRNVGSESRKHLFADLSKPSLSKTCLIVHDLSKHSKHVFNYAQHHKKFKQPGIAVRDIKGRMNPKKLRLDIFNKGVFHGSCTLTNVLHIGLHMQYKKFIFVGVDLKNSYYFWLPKNAVRENIRRKGLSSKARHPVYRSVIRLIRVVKKHFPVKMVTANRKSGLRSVIEFESFL